MTKRFELILGMYGLSRNSETSQGYEIVERVEALRLLKVASKAGIPAVDTSPCYGSGNADALLSTSRINDKTHFFVNTKIGRNTLASDYSHSEVAVEQQLIDMNNRHTKYLKIVFLHSPPRDILQSSSSMNEIKKRIRNVLGSRVRIGISFANPEDVLVLTENFNFDVAQLNMSLLDLRAVKSGALNLLRERGIEVHARSIFCSGLLKYGNKLLSTIDKNDARRWWKAEFIASMGLRLNQILEMVAELKLEDVNELALSVFHSYSLADKVIIGPTSMKELKGLLEGYQRARTLDGIDLKDLVKISGF